MGMQTVKRTEAAEKKQSEPVCFVAVGWGISKALDINFTCDVLFEGCLDISDSESDKSRWGFIHSDSKCGQRRC